MYFKLAVLLSVVFTSALTSTNIFAQPPGGDRGDDRRAEPPQEAIDACEGKVDGDTTSFVSPRGDTITGTCRTMQSIIFLIPDDHHPHGPHGSSTGRSEGGNNI